MGSFTLEPYSGQVCGGLHSQNNLSHSIARHPIHQVGANNQNTLSQIHPCRYSATYRRSTHHLLITRVGGVLYDDEQLSRQDSCCMTDKSLTTRQGTVSIGFSYFSYFRHFVAWPIARGRGQPRAPTHAAPYRPRCSRGCQRLPRWPRSAAQGQFRPCIGPTRFTCLSA